ncbi:unnamed protein product [Adineta steineri]|uniref:Uncharacterized protein n=1 Tax=Adineta steineri TaxID=433720 RepID=A0A818HFS0_9BILA|nr:unnamed protein product [Adineta steineri]CAF3505549.1 unnamed protein product [Adineta steineri]
MNLTHQFDINLYRSTWKFIDKHTIRVRFHLHESLLSSTTSTRFIVRHTNTDHIETFDKPHEIINSTLSLYLHNIKHGRHTVCLLIYTSKLMRNPKHVFCQDIIFNFHKYGHHDIDSDDHGNTFFFLLTQYAIVCGILCILQLVHTIRKRRFMKTVYHKANTLRNLMTEYHHRLQETKPTTETTTNTNEAHALDSLIYNLNRNALRDFDQACMQKQDEDEHYDNLISYSSSSDHQRSGSEKYSKLSSNVQYRSVPTINDHVDFNESDCDDKSASFKSVSHILEANKPWMTKLSDNNTVEHFILSSVPLQINSRELIL